MLFLILSHNFWPDRLRLLNGRVYGVSYEYKVHDLTEPLPFY